VQPGRQEAGAVEGAFDRGGLAVVDGVGEADQLPQRRAGAALAAGGAQVAGRGRVVLLGGDRVSFGAESGEALADVAELGVEVGAFGDRGGLAFGGELAEELAEAGLAGLSCPLECRGERFDGIREGDPAGRPGGQFVRDRLERLRQVLGRLRGGLFLFAFGGLLGPQVLLGEVSSGLRVADCLEEAADLADVIAAGRDPGSRGVQQLVARVDGAEAVVGDASALGRVVEDDSVAVGFVAGLGGPAGQLDGRPLELLDLAAVAAVLAALIRQLLGAPRDLAALVLDPALGLVLLGVPQAGQPALSCSPSSRRAFRAVSASCSAPSARWCSAAASRIFSACVAAVSIRACTRSSWNFTCARR